MVDIVFLTTNNTKLAHAKYLCRDYSVNIVSHKLIHYGISYNEPRLLDREQLIEESAKDAINRWKKKKPEKKTFTSTDSSDQQILYKDIFSLDKSEKESIENLDNSNKIFFFEDTSVKIHGLSSLDNEVPGVDIKYWMKENTFEIVNLELLRKGNDRRVSVFSHVVLVLPDDLKTKYNKEYITFSSRSDGYIIDSEMFFETNRVYPWLDNKSFNKWFVPNGEELPISLLPIEKADLYDFRKDAFNEMLLFLFSNNKIHEKRNKEINFRFTSNPIFLIVGPTCAGKTTLGEYLLSTYNYYHIEASDFMNLEFLETHGSDSNIDIGDFAKEILNVKPQVVVDRILEYIEKLTTISSLVITGFRTQFELEHFERFTPIRGNNTFIYINSDYETRYNRWLIRNREEHNSRVDFDNINNLQNDIGIDKLIFFDKIKNFNNNSSLNDYYSNFKNMFLLQNKIVIEDEFNNFSDIIPRFLEDAIILTLAKEYKNDNNKFFSTTEISNRINLAFKNNIEEKHKDNVSRYFNQRFYPYYKLKNYNGKVKYKLSSTGYSHSLILMRNLFYKVS